MRKNPYYKRKKPKFFFVFTLLCGLIILLSPLIAGIFLNDLEDVDTDTATSCNILHYNGTAWVNWDLWNQTITWYKPHTFIDIITSQAYYGDGGNLTNITGATDGYAGDQGHPHDQDLNTSSDVTFNSITGDGSGITNLPLHNLFNQDLNTTNNVLFNWVTAQSFFGDGGNLTNISGVSDGYAGDTGHPHDQDLNISSSVNFSHAIIHGYTDHRLILGESAFNLSMYVYKQSGLPDMYHAYMKGRALNNFRIDVSGNDDFQIDNTGVLDFPKQSGARARLTSAQNVNGGLLTTLILSTEDYDQNNDFNTGTYRFVAPVEGLYQVSYSVMVFNMPDRTYLYSCIYKNGNDIGGHEISYSSTSGLTDLSNSGSDILRLSANDYLELKVKHSAFGFKQFPANAWTNYMAVCKIA